MLSVRSKYIAAAWRSFAKKAGTRFNLYGDEIPCRFSIFDNLYLSINTMIMDKLFPKQPTVLAKE